MAGHSKWANIKHKKGRADARKGKIFSRAAKEIISAVKDGGPDPKGNAKLRLAIQKAKAVNVPNEIIERNIKKASSSDQAAYHEITYELYGHGGVGIIIEIMTDNKNRISSEIRVATNKRGGTIANPGSVAFNFDKKGVIQVNSSEAVEEELFEAVSEAGAEGFEQVEDFFVITTDATELMAVKDAIDHLGVKVEEASLQLIPQNIVEVDVETAKSNLALMEWLEDLEDVDAVYHTMELPEGLEEE